MSFSFGNMLVFIYLVGFLVIFPHIDGRKLPDSFGTCYRFDPKLRECMIREGNKVLKQFTKGIPELGIVPTDPFNVGDLDVFPKTSSLSLSYKNCIMRGLRNSKLLDLYLDHAEKTGIMRLAADLTVNGKYEIAGRILIIPLTGKGESTIKLKGCDMTSNFTWDLYTAKDGKEYVHVKDYTIDYDYEDAKFKFTGLFDNDKVLAEATERVLSENSKEAIAEVGKPGIAEILKRTVKIINQFYSKVPYDELFPIN